jgi:competence protein ComGC
MKNQKGFTLVEGLLIVLFVSIVGFAGYTVWNNNSEENDSPNETSQLKNSDEEGTEPPKQEQTVATEPAAEELQVATTDIFSTGYRNEQTGILLDFLISEGYDQYWAEYGQTPGSLSKQTTKKSEGLGYSFDNGYGGFVIVINPSDLPSGDNIYFYRIAATKNGQTFYTGINAFNYK